MNTNSPWYEILIQYHNHQGGVNNIQTATVKTMEGGVLKTFSSQKNRAKEYANSFIRKHSKNK